MEPRSEAQKPISMRQGRKEQGHAFYRGSCLYSAQEKHSGKALTVSQESLVLISVLPLASCVTQGMFLKPEPQLYTQEMRKENDIAFHVHRFTKDLLIIHTKKKS